MTLQKVELPGETSSEEDINEGKTISKENVRKVQNH